MHMHDSRKVVAFHGLILHYRVAIDASDSNRQARFRYCRLNTEACPSPEHTKFEVSNLHVELLCRVCRIG